METVIMNELPIGSAIIEPALLRALKALWEGPLEPAHLPPIERAIRAFLTAPVLTLARWDGIWTAAVPPDRLDYQYEEPFGDQFLDFEFQHPRNPHPCVQLGRDESSFLGSLVQRRLLHALERSLPPWVQTEGQACAFVDGWYTGEELNETETNKIVEQSDLPWRNKKFRGFRSLNHAIQHLGPLEHAEYLVGCHRAGFIVYGRSPISHICSEHVFTKWPNHLFKTLDKEYRRAAVEIRGPGIGLCLPPVTALLLSKARGRDDIPEALRDMRDQYKKARTNLAEMLLEMWYAPSFYAQLKIVRKLEGAATSLFKAAFPEAIQALSVGLSATKLLTGDLVSPLETLQAWNEPKARVAAVSFAATLARDLRRNLLNHRDVLKRHLTQTELREFGVGFRCLLTWTTNPARIGAQPAKKHLTFAPWGYFWGYARATPSQHID